MELKCRGRIGNDGKLKIYHRSKLEKDCLSYAETDVDIVIKKSSKVVSKGQRGYWYGVIIPIIHEGLREAGNNITLSKTEEFIVDEFLTVESIKEDKSGIKSTRYTLNNEIPSKIFHDALEELKIFASENLGVSIPEPNER